MATLTQISLLTRRTIKYGTIALVAFIVIRTSYGIAKDVWRKLNPPPPPQPTVAFGKLPKIKFPEKEGLPELSFKLETIEGDLPTLIEVGKVYFMPKKRVGFLALDRAKIKARGMGFTTLPKQISEYEYHWETPTAIPATLDMNIKTDNFVLNYPYQKDSILLSSRNIPSDEQAASEAKNFLQAGGYLLQDLANGKAESTYWRFIPPNLIPALSMSEANFVRVNLFRADLDEMPILPPNPKKTLITFLFSGSGEHTKRMVEIKYTYYPIEKEISATYPLKSVNTAWKELQKGEGHIANLGENQDGNIIIRKTYLAYYDSEELQDFLQPIFVFEGDRNFFGYVPAIDPKWLE